MDATPLPGASANVPWLQFQPGTGLGWTDGTELDVDLTFLVGADYTIFAVISRFGDTSPSGNYFLGTGSVTQSLNYGALHLGYYDDTDFRFSEFGNDIDASVPSNLPGQWQLALVTGEFSKTGGHTLYLGGNLVGSNPDQTAMQSALQGAVGRGFLATAGSTQYQGGIGEILIFTEALSSTDRAAVENYLRTKWRLP
ncbi:MAG: hypothetical protein JST54_26280 [Deltaproteobacteria bacterium]|nr:hypothetical protein [Deltaproteobacteria bacterium]